MTISASVDSSELVIGLYLLSKHWQSQSYKEELQDNFKQFQNGHQHLP